MLSTKILLVQETENTPIFQDDLLRRSKHEAGYRRALEDEGENWQQLNIINNLD